MDTVGDMPLPAATLERDLRSVDMPGYSAGGEVSHGGEVGSDHPGRPHIAIDSSALRTMSSLASTRPVSGPAIHSLSVLPDVILDRLGAVEAAEAAELGDQISLLEAAIARVCPVLGMISARIESSYVRFVDGVGGVDTQRFFRRRGVVLAGPGEQAIGQGRSGVRGGQVGGDSLVLWEDGSPGCIRYSGSWSCYSGDADRMRTSAAAVTPRHALIQYDLECCLSSLDRALTLAAERLNAQGARIASLQLRSAELRQAVETIQKG